MQTRKQKIYAYLDSDKTYLGALYYSRHLRELIDQRFCQVHINMNDIRIRLPHDYPIEWFYGDLYAVVRTMSAVLEGRMRNYLDSVVSEIQRRMSGEEPAEFDELGEWLIENRRLNEFVVSSIIGDIIDRNRDIYESIYKTVEHLVCFADKEYSVEGHWPIDGYYVINIKDGDTVVANLSVGRSCHRISQMNFD